MFDIAWTEMLIVAVLIIVVVGPKDLPRLMRAFGTMMGKMRRMASDFQRSMEELSREAELDELKEVEKTIRKSSTAKPSDIAREYIDPTGEFGYMGGPMTSQKASPEANKNEKEKDSGGKEEKADTSQTEKKKGDETS